MSFWKEIKNTHVESSPSCELQKGIKEIVYIDAWRTDDEDEEGKVIAQVVKCDCDNIFVIYIDNVARADMYAQRVIRETVDRLKDKQSEA